MKKLVKKKILEYTVIFEPAKEGGYVVRAPALPGCVTQGETFEEATKMIKDAIKGYLAVLQQERQEIPKELFDVIITKVAVSSPSAYL